MSVIGRSSNDRVIRWECPIPDGGGVYLIHFSEPFGHARHYTGWSKDDIVRRIRQHASGSTTRGSKLCWYAVQAGRNLVVSRVWPGAGRDKEKSIKKSSATKYCPICKANVTVDDFDLDSLSELSF